MHHLDDGDGRLGRIAALRLQAPWVNGLSDELAIKDIETAHGVILALRRKLDGNEEPEASA